MINERRQTVLSRSEEETERIGRELANTLTAGTLITLDGELGAGKTTLAAAIAAGRGIERVAIQSPTYVIMRPYLTGNIPIYHWDFYRIASIDELNTADFRELLDERRSLFLVEWASLFKEAWSAFYPRIEITLTPGVAHESRSLTLVYRY